MTSAVNPKRVLENEEDWSVEITNSTPGKTLNGPEIRTKNYFITLWCRNKGTFLDVSMRRAGER